MPRSFPSTILQLVITVALGAGLACGGGGSNQGTPQSTSNPTPILASLNPASVPAGNPAFTLQVVGSNFVPASTVSWNGSPRTTTYLSSSTLSVQITAADVAAAGNIQVAVSNPAPGGGTSTALTFPIQNGGAGVTARVVQIPADQMVWDASHGVIYLSIPSVAGASGNSIATLDPSTGTLTGSQFAGSEPNLLALSDDATKLYVSLDGSSNIKRFSLPSMTPDLTVNLGADSFFGPYWAKDMQIAPGTNNTIAVSLGANRGGSPEALGGVAIYDDGTARPTMVPGFGGTGHLFDSLQWGSTANALYSANYESTGFDFYVLSVNPSGVSLVQDYGSVFTNFYSKIHYDRGTNFVYSDDGHVIDPASGHPVATFSSRGLMVPDSTVNQAFFLGQTQSQFGSKNYTILAYDLTRFTPNGSTVVQNVNGSPIQLIRWGTNGLCFNTNAGSVYLLSGPFIKPQSSMDPTETTWNRYERNR